MITFFAPIKDSTVRSIKSSRACTSTCNHTSSGEWPFSMSRRFEGEFRVRRGRKADFDFLETDFHERLEQFQFLRNVHRHGERLIAIAQIHAAPSWRVRERARRPLAVGQLWRVLERAIFLRRILHVVCFLIIAVRR